MPTLIDNGVPRKSGDHPIESVDLFGTRIHCVTMSQAVRTLQTWTEPPFTRCRYVVTPNVDHIVLLQTHTALRQAYRDADLVLADGWPVVSAAQWLRCPIPERVPGSDLVPEILATAAESPLRVFLLGAAPGVGNRAAVNIMRRWEGVDIVGVSSPPLGFERDALENQQILRLIERAAPDLLVVGLGAPKQELWVRRHRDQFNAKVALCVGATIDFLAGERRRAPRWMRRVGLEWFYRALREPKRLGRRYARDAWVFPRLVWREWRQQRTGYCSPDSRST